MIPGLEPIPLRDLQALGTVKTWTVEGSLEELPSLTPVRGSLQAEHRGNVLEVKGAFQTIVTLCCDRCLGQFNQLLSADVEELIWLGDTHNDEARIAAGLESDGVEGLVESLDPRGSFEPERWVFEQLSLQLTVVNRCGPDCPGPPGSTAPTSEVAEDSGRKPIDPRWQALQQLTGGGDDAA